MLIVFVINTITKAQNSPSNASHLLSLTEGISAPFRLAVNSTGTIYITDVTQKNVVKYDKSFNYIGSINVGVNPSAIAINSSDEVFVGDLETGIIYKLDAGDNATVFSTIINSTSSMVFDSNNLLYVVDSKLKQVRVLDTDGNYLRSIGTEDFIYPTAITYDVKNDRIFVSEHGGLEGGFFGSPDAKIWIYDTDGNNLGEVGSGGTGDGQFMKIQGLAVSQFGTFFIIDQSLSSISIFEENETYLNEFGEYGSVPGKLYTPMDVVFDYQGRTIVSSMGSGTVEVYYINQINPTYEITAVDEIICPGGNTDIHVDFTGTGPWTFTYTKNGLNPVTVTNSSLDPYVFNVADTGLYEVTAMSDANFAAVDYTSKVRVSQNLFPTSNITSGDTEICNGDNTDISIGLTGAAPWRINYTDGSTTKVISNITTSPYVLNVDQTGTYEVTYVEGAGGCTASTMTGIANINVNTLLAEITSMDTTICEGETVDIPITFTGTAPWTFTYSINDIDQTPITTSNNPYILTSGTVGTYVITDLSDAFISSMCFSGAANISVNPLPTSNIIAANASFCEGGSTNIIIELTGTAPWDLTYTIDGINPVSVTGINTSPYVFSVQDTGLYEVTALEDNNCSGISFTGGTKVSENPIPTSNIDIGKETFTIFNGATLNYNVKLTGTAPWSFTYTSDGTNPITINTDTSSYILTLTEDATYEIPMVTDANCTSTSSTGSIDIWYDTSPTAKITSGDVTMCEGATTEIEIELTGTAPWSITYTVDGLDPTLVNTSTSPFILSVSEAGSYKVSALSDANKSGVYFPEYANITVNPKPTSNLTNNNISVCEGETATIPIELTGTAPWTFEYTIDDLNSIEILTSNNSYLLNVSQNGVYKITSLSDANCNSTNMSGISDVVINPLPTVNLGIDTAICEGEKLALDAGSFTSYLWNDGSTTQSIEVNTEGTFNVNVFDVNGCTNSDEILISINPLAVSDFTYTENNLEISFLNNSINANSYLWNFGDSNTSTDSDPIYTYKTPGGYNVSLIATNSECGDSVLTKTISVINTDISDIDFENTINVYPNPFDGLITIDLANLNQIGLEIEIINIAGQKVFFKKIESAQSIEKIDLRNLSKGVYTLNLISKDWTKTTKIILSK